ncbi:fused MFS/spermidine synthase [Lacihabitans sp. CS3-21]|uniref:fused MFS/spermidine synthase n=1 Tax=Lacihabitans sp. CS3-21 TaxID=2487332 RepID=UPI0020CB90D7|nr:fused MFS/spermidine synthase [Lacihabitans sp. CS3-21]MCP9748939.1 MFS transporter [Lacihabitans sp. CS3-21]
MNSNPKSRNLTALFLISIYFFSGFAALVYQVIWQRWLAFFTGISSVNISLIVSAFMAGLGIGYLAGGYLSDRLQQGKHVFYFFLAEIGIGIFAFFSKSIFYDWLFVENSSFQLGSIYLYMILFLLLLVPTFLMGVSLPLLSKAFKNIGNQGNFISLLYFTNTLGAAIGTFITSFYLIPNMGFEKAIYVAAGLNFFCGLSVLLFNYLVKREASKQDEKAPLTDKLYEEELNVPFKFWLIQYFISGFTAISLEIIWFRMIDVMMKSYAVTFSIILTIYLGSMAIGTWLGVIFNKKYKKGKLKTFLWIQITLYSYVAVSIALLYFSVENIGFLEPLRGYFEGYEEIPSFKLRLITMLIIPIFLMSIPTFIMGFSFSVSQNIIQNDFSLVGKKLGTLQFINIAGSTAGAWFASLIGFEILGTSLTLKLLLLTGFIYIAILGYQQYLSKINAALMSFVLLVLVFLVPEKQDFWRVVSGVNEETDFIFSEDKTALSSIKIGEENSTVFINGLGQSHFPMKTDYFHIMLGAVPAFLHPNPERIGIIGLGSAGTLYGASGRASTTELVCWEVIKSQPSVLFEYVKRTQDSSAYFILNDKRLALKLEDGRKEIQSSSQKYDVLEADALRPRSSYAGNLYSVEYFSLLKSKLKPKGYAVTWAPTERIKRSFRVVFPYVYEIQESLYLGSDSPINFDRKVILNRFDEPFSEAFYKRADIDAKAIMNNFLNTLKIIQEGKLLDNKDINTDMWPKDEYQVK